MLVLTLLLAAVGFALLVIALVSGSVVWAWVCITVCIVGALLLLASALSGRDRGAANSAFGAGPNSGSPNSGSEPSSKGRHSRP